MAISRFDPFFGSVLGDDLFSSMLSSLPHTSDARNNQAVARGIPIDVKEEKDKYAVKADIPGVTKDKIHLNVDGDMLSIGVENTSGKDEHKEEAGVKWHRVERRSSFARRAIRMPESANLSKVSAKYENGVLQVEIPKQEARKDPKQITIQ